MVNALMESVFVTLVFSEKIVLNKIVQIIATTTGIAK